MLDSPVDEIKSRLNIVEVIQEYIQLKQAGTNFKALCPFHREKTPSFMVSADKQIWHCFGCGEGGDIFTFVMKMEGAEFPEALRILAKKANVVLRVQDPKIQNQKTKLLDLVKFTAEFYHKILRESEKTQFVRDYLKKRNIKEETQEDFKLGYAPDSWNLLNDFLMKKGYLEEDIFQAGLTLKKEKEEGYYDRFRGRLIFPLSDVHGNIVGFGGRTMEADQENIPKYLNSPQTLIYNKSVILYGLDKAKQDIKKENVAIVVEGYMDALSSYQAGVTNVVASAGTALTEAQVRILKRYSNNLALSFDMDQAGEEAVKRGIETALGEEMSLKVIRLPFGKDPDECIQKDGSAWLKAVKDAKPILEYYFENTFSKLDTEKVEDKKQAVKILLPVISKIGNAIEQTHYLQELGRRVNVDEKILRDSLHKFLSGKMGRLKPEKEKAEGTPSKAKNRYQLLVEESLGLVLFYPKNLEYFINHLTPEYILDPKLNELYKKLVIYYTETKAEKVEKLREQFEKDNKELGQYFDILFLSAQDRFEGAEEDVIKKVILDCIRGIKINYISHKLKEIEEAFKKLEVKKTLSQQDKDTQKELSEKFKQFSDQLAELNQKTNP